MASETVHLRRRPPAQPKRPKDRGKACRHGRCADSDRRASKGTPSSQRATQGIFEGCPFGTQGYSEYSTGYPRDIRGVPRLVLKGTPSTQRATQGKIRGVPRLVLKGTRGCRSDGDRRSVICRRAHRLLLECDAVVLARVAAPPPRDGALALRPVGRYCALHVRAKSAFAHRGNRPPGQCHMCWRTVLPAVAPSSTLHAGQCLQYRQ
jgi:hypothetical protein